MVRKDAAVNSTEWQHIHTIYNFPIELLLQGHEQSDSSKTTLKDVKTMENLNNGSF